MEDAYSPANAEARTDRFVVVTGCSGGGKSSLLAELARRGERVFEEPGRQIVKEQDWIDGTALPWSQPQAFAELALSRSMHQLITAAGFGERSFFDRSLIDQIAWFERTGQPVPAHFEAAAARCRYNRVVFLAPPWPEIFRTDAERRHGFDEAVAEYGALITTYGRLGYQLVELPKTSVSARADMVLARLGEGQ